MVLLRLDIEAGVLLRDTLHRRQQRRQVLDVGGIGADGVEQRLTLIAVALIAHIENVFQFRVVGEHAIVKVGGQLYRLLPAGEWWISRWRWFGYPAWGRSLGWDLDDDCNDVF